MPDRDPRRLALCAVAAVVLVALSGWYLTRSRPSAAASPAPAPATIAVGADDDGGGDGGGGTVVVDVDGEVHHPGVLHLPAGSRVEAALDRAGGATKHADLTQVNRAAKVSDGREILVPRRQSAAAAAASAAEPSPAAPGAPSVPIDLNTATAAQFETLDGVGPATAQKIIDYRTAHGGFGSVDELDQVPGIGPKRLAALRPHLHV